MTDVHVAAPSIEDVADITSLWVALVEDQREHGAHLLGEENRADGRAVIEQYVHADGLAIAREGEGKLVGFVMFHVERGLYEQDVRRGIVENVFVVPDRRGEGIGSRLLDFAESELADRNAAVVALSVLADNEAALEWYRERGYHPHRLTMERSIDETES
ncbi:GNAT family N-acetyltransferase [Halanaeroarchaeum sulfurireducens]|uniref:Sporulation regulator-like protein n=1 Tax=Halanaeroarchaeum sulfurireducens TaxID=1604004 RepID=A0A0N9N6N4_9EURY|nr:GNAT family N-acetyltransferase [Halanaeroarchaeum sulfurireducens]ALG82500.1 sporulation regulator-like protein [Halanaeroarchaeum sulfurireducens]